MNNIKRLLLSGIDPHMTHRFSCVFNELYRVQTEGGGNAHLRWMITAEEEKLQWQSTWRSVLAAALRLTRQQVRVLLFNYGVWN